jgi:hypothetical protein
MKTPQDNDGLGATRAKPEAPAPKPRHSTRARPPRFLYFLDYDKRFPGRPAMREAWPLRSLRINK